MRFSFASLSACLHSDNACGAVFQDSGFTAVKGAGGGMHGMTGARRAHSVALSSPAPFSAAAAR
eukprot:1130862-Rhodomonas_salina.1